MASGEGVNVRYRGSVLTVGCGPDLDAAVDASDGYERRLSEDQLDGWLDWAKAAPHVRRVQAGYVELQDRTPS